MDNPVWEPASAAAPAPEPAAEGEEEAAAEEAPAAPTLEEKMEAYSTGLRAITDAAEAAELTVTKVRTTRLFFVWSFSYVCLEPVLAK